MTNGSDKFDLEQFRLPTSADAKTMAPSTQCRSRPGAQRFVKVPLVWKVRLDEARHLGTYKIAVELLFRCWKSGGKSVVLTNVATKQIGVPARSKSRALRELEQLGLIRVERHPRKSPEVVLLLLEDHNPRADGA